MSVTNATVEPATCSECDEPCFTALDEGSEGVCYGCREFFKREWEWYEEAMHEEPVFDV